MRIHDAAVVTAAGVLEPGFVEVADGRVTAARAGAPPGPARPGDLNAGGDWLFPGFIDLHVHGCLGRDLMELDPAHWQETRRFLAARGVTAFLATSSSAPAAELARFADVAREQRGGRTPGSRLLGVHQEGPWLNPGFAGMHPVAQCRPPEPDEVRRLLPGGVVRRVTAALELAGGEALLEACLAEGVLLSLGHTACLACQVRAWASKGLRHATHLTNAMSRAEKRGPVRVCGALEGILASPGVAAEVLLDGNHVPEELFRVALLCKGASGLSAASDATPFTGLPAAEGQVLRYGGPEGQEARISQGRATSLDGSSLVGSIMPLGDMLPRALAWCDHDAVAASRILSTTAADLLGEPSLGRIAAGCAADLVLAARPSGAVRAVWIKGERQ